VKGSGWHKGRPPAKAQFDSTCPECGELIEIGDTIHWDEYHDAYVCDLCGRS
jgi:predicted RNA-binding Zn-ribbon protein involved in translation (DUF1610 family)